MLSADVERDGRADELQQHERRHRQPERVERAVGDGERRALVDGGDDLAEEPGEQPVHHERRCVGDEHAGLAQRLADRERGRQRWRRRSARPARSPAAACTATGLKKWNPTTRSGCASSAAISVTDSDEVLVARTHSGADDGLDLREHLLLDRQVLEHRLDHEVGVGEGVLVDASR